MKDQRIIDLSNLLMQAERTGNSIPPLTETTPELTVEQAYRVQLHTVSCKLEEGQRISGKKIGLTSEAMQNLLGVGEPDYGHLFDRMAVPNGGEISYAKIMQPRVEGEIAFVLKRDLKGPHVTVEEVLQATEYVVPALEIVGSRITDWKIKLADTIADNASSGMYVLGERRLPVDQLNLPEIQMEFYKNDQLVNTGAGSAVLGDPAYCVAWLANKLSAFDISLKAGEVILSGALSAMVNVEPGDTFQARFTHLGEVSVSFSKH